MVRHNATVRFQQCPRERGAQMSDLPNCPKCGTKMKFYDGCLGYESIVCPDCRYDINDSVVPNKED